MNHRRKRVDREGFVCESNELSPWDARGKAAVQIAMAIHFCDRAALGDRYAGIANRLLAITREVILAPVED
jgi:hypothetical protein